MKANARNSVKFGLSILALTASAWMARSDSLFPIKEANKAIKGSKSSTLSSLFTDARAHNVDDILFVTIVESTTAQSSANTKFSQDENVGILNGTGLFDRLLSGLSLSAGQSRSGNGAGQTTRTGTLVTSLSVMIKEVLPNGTLRIEGSRDVTINNETQRVVFSGIIRPEDITRNNTIPSTLVANAAIRYDGKGIIGNTQKPGLLTRIFRYLF
ncbi:flagellar basal body L-ring protein FlgH [Nostoc sp. CHAB 5824]|nr:flagellar basal body L-ring protein FlgH [Nostoc sp. CHAB 5824]